MRRRRLPLAVLAALAVAAAPGLGAAHAEPSPRAPAAAAPSVATFPIEDIRVVGLRRGSPRVVLAASRLDAGGSYDEAELARAVARVRRLPFVLDARFRLEKGSERGRYALVIEVVETRRFFFGAELSVAEYGRPLAFDRQRGAGGDVRREALAGIRQTIGSAGELTAGLDTEEGLQAAYTQYDLFGRGAVAGIAVAARACCSSEVLPLGLLPELTHFSPNEGQRVQAHLAVPVAGDHAWRLAAEWARSERFSARPVRIEDDGLIVFGDELERRRLALDWVFDDTDDPVLATRGRRLVAGVERLEVAYRPTGARSRAPDLPEPALDGREIGSTLHRLHAAGRWFVPLGLEQAVSFHGRAAVGAGDAEWVRRTGIERDDVVSYELSVGAGHTWRLWRSPAEDPRPGELWLESGVEAGWESTNGSGSFADNPILRLAADVGIAYRSTWGLFRFVVGVRDLPEVD